MRAPAQPGERALDPARGRRAQRRDREAGRRRLTALAVVAVAAAVGGAIVGARGGDDDSQPIAAPQPACPARVAAEPRRLVGQMLIVRMEATATDGLRRALRRGEIGGVVLFPPAATRPRDLAREIASLRAAAAAGGAVPPLVMIDQEGGEVKRLPTLPPDRPPDRLGAGGKRAAVEQGRKTAAALAGLGIDVDLAPVLDVPATPDSFIASRALGSDPAAVARIGAAFAEGLEAERVAATAKHFPGLGLAPANTDLAPSSVGATRAELAPGLEPFEAAIASGVDLVMIANAIYEAYDPDRPASQSPRVIEGLLRRRLGYGGAVVTDDLGAQALAQAGIAEGEAAVAAASAGADLLLFALSDGDAAREALVSALRRGGLEREALIRSCARSTSLRARLSGA